MYSIYVYSIVNSPYRLYTVYIQYILYTGSELLQTPWVMGEISWPFVPPKNPS